MFPIASFERIENHEADRALKAWQHYLGPCNRPYGKQSFGLFWLGQLAAVAVSATLVKKSIYGIRRTEACELARSCTAPGHRDLTRVCIRLYRMIAADEWSREYWPCTGLISYNRKDRHTGDVYRFDGWRLVTNTRASKVGSGSHHSTAGREIPAKSLWVWPPEVADRPEVKAAVARNQPRKERVNA